MFDFDYGNSNFARTRCWLLWPPGAKLNQFHLMKDKSKVVLWVCFTVLIASGLKYVPPYLVEQRRLDMQERMLDIREDAFLHQKPAPTVSVPEEVHANSAQLL
jgi:hypothetical protein